MDSISDARGPPADCFSFPLPSDRSATRRQLDTEADTSPARRQARQREGDVRSAGGSAPARRRGQQQAVSVEIPGCQASRSPLAGPVSPSVKMPSDLSINAEADARHDSKPRPWRYRPRWACTRPEATVQAESAETPARRSTGRQPGEGGHNGERYLEQYLFAIGNEKRPCFSVMVPGAVPNHWKPRQNKGESHVHRGLALHCLNTVWTVF